MGYDPSLPTMLRKLLANGAVDQVVRQAQAEADEDLAEFRAAAHCDTVLPDPGCAVPFRYISHVLRGSAPERVFTQMVVAMELAERDPRFAAVNLVQPEDGAVALRDYSLHMRMLGHLHRAYPRAHITLHAGELAPGLAKPEDLRFHIREAVHVAHAERIGHGVDVRHEDGADELLRTMAERRIAVEVPLSSNDQILGISGPEHPFPLYRERGVPIVLATDDAGVSRITISEEYRRAARTYDLSYRDLKDLARASLDSAFPPGRSLWRTPDGYRPVFECLAGRPGMREPGPLCAGFLAANPKAAVEWRQEAAFTAFERRILAPTRAHPRPAGRTRSPAPHGTQWNPRPGRALGRNEGSRPTRYRAGRTSTEHGVAGVSPGGRRLTSATLWPGTRRCAHAPLRYAVTLRSTCSRYSLRLSGLWSDRGRAGIVPLTGR